MYQESITVQASAPLVRTRESELSAILDAKQVDELPTNGRNFLSLLQTSGSVVPTGGGSGAISVNGQGTRMANFVADGVSITGREIRTLNGEFGGGNGLSLDVIKELQVISNGFKAETGQTGAGTISIVTKSGTNTLAGSAYGFWRPTDFVAANLLTGAKTSQKRYQYGGTIGGPIKKDVTHFFANYEYTNINDASVVTSVLAPGTFPAPQTQKQGFFKLNHRFSDAHALDARYNFNRNKQENQSIGGLNTFDRRSNTEAQTDAFVTSLVSNFGTNKVNEARFRYTYDVVDFYSPLTASSGPASRTPDFSNAPVSGDVHGRRQSRHEPRVPAEPRREARPVGGSLLDHQGVAPAEDRRRRDRVVAVCHFFQQFRRHLHLWARREIPVQRERSGDLPDAVHADVRRIGVALQGRDRRAVRAG